MRCGDNTGFTLVEDPLRAGYYSEIDMLVWAKKFYGDDFVTYLQKTYNPLDVVFRLANETSLVLLNGGGFAGPKWSVRVSLANLNEADYVKSDKASSVCWKNMPKHGKHQKNELSSSFYK